MTLEEEIMRYGSVAIVGLAKNAGKTECLNFILRRLQDKGRLLGLTSIGVDGEDRDVVFRTEKPEVTVYEGSLFVTSETHYHGKRLVSEVLGVSERRTALGRLVTARACDSGKVILSGPPDTASLKTLISDLHGRGAATVIVDGALSRLSFSSPAVTEALVLATGAAVSNSIDGVVRRTRFVYDMISLPAVADASLRASLAGIEKGVWGIDDCGGVHDLEIPSLLMLDRHKDSIFSYGTTLYAPGAITEKLLAFLRSQPQCSRTTLIMRDFTRMFAEPATVAAYLQRGGRIEVLLKNRLLAISINPRSPQGYILDSDRLREALQSHVDVPVYDVVREEMRQGI